MSTLKPCPFCGEGETRVDEKTYWTGQSNQLISVTVIHWCNHGHVDGAIIKVSGRTADEAYARWNSRIEKAA